MQQVQVFCIFTLLLTVQRTQINTTNNTWPSFAHSCFICSFNMFHFAQPTSRHCSVVLQYFFLSIFEKVLCHTIFSCRLSIYLSLVTTLVMERGMQFLQRFLINNHQKCRYNDWVKGNNYSISCRTVWLVYKNDITLLGKVIHEKTYHDLMVSKI